MEEKAQRILNIYETGVSETELTETLKTKINASTGGSLGSIKPTDSAPTPARNGNYTFSIGGAKPAWLTAEAGITEVKAGDGVAVVYTAPSSYSYTHVDVMSGAELKTNKQNSLAPDGTGNKFPTVDAVNAGLNKLIEKKETEEDGFFVTDKSGNIILRIDSNGFDVNKFSEHFISLLPEIPESEISRLISYSETLAIQIIKIYDPLLFFVGYCDTASEEPLSHAQGSVWVVAESGVIWGINAIKGQIIIDDGTNYIARNISINSGGQLKDVYETEEDGFFVTDKSGNIILRIDSNGFDVNKFSDSVQRRLRFNGGIFSTKNEPIENLSYINIPLKVGNNLWEISADIDVSLFDKILIGRGFYIYQGGYIEIGTSEIKIYFVDAPGEQTLLETAPHGLTILNNVKVYISLRYNIAKIIIISGSGYFEHETANLWGNYDPFVKSINTTGTLKSFSLNTKEDFTKQTVVISDSYGGENNLTRWVGNLYLNYGITSFMTSNMSGCKSPEAYDLLVEVLKYVKPKYVIWNIGMNDASDTLTYDPIWKTYFDLAIQKCNENNVEIILATLPSMLGIAKPRDHRKKTEHMKTIGKRIIDFDLAVSDGNGTWKAGLLSADQVHPTEVGAKVLAMQVITDFIEILNNN